ncbi:uncharacterized protein G2W53_036074 [Senna tora]|uniref:Uncharacterized protein n=1 Tax=Senna tora TaxID=362788 RepID=A0A834W8C1_9FABA|nr:uncharacterized protein G2W53_036074 [Senna tora]
MGNRANTRHTNTTMERLKYMRMDLILYNI